jgi:hypothetical protein
VPRRNASYQVRKSIEKLARHGKMPQSKVNMNRAMGRITLRPSATISYGSNPGAKVSIVRPGTFQRRTSGELRPVPTLDKAFKALKNSVGKKDGTKPLVISKGAKRVPVRHV